MFQVFEKSKIGNWLIIYELVILIFSKTYLSVSNKGCSVFKTYLSFFVKHMHSFFLVFAFLLNSAAVSSLQFKTATHINFPNPDSILLASHYKYFTSNFSFREGKLVTQEYPNLFRKRLYKQ